MDTMAITSYQFTLDSAIAEWLAQKEIRTGSRRTWRSYRDALVSFRAFLAQVNLDLLSDSVDIARLAPLWASTRTLRRHQPESDLVKPVAASTYNQRLAILSSWYTFVQETYHLDLPNPIEEVKKRPVQAYAAAVPLSPETIIDGLEEINRRSLQGKRDYALIAVAVSTGRRASELVGLRGQNVKIARSGRHSETQITLTFHCKGGKVKRDLLDVETSEVLLDYLQGHYGASVSALPPEAPVWVSYSKQNAGRPIGVRTLSDICAAYLDTSKSHALRHTFAVGMIRSGAPITELKHRLGHTDIRVTQIYTEEIMGDENPYAEKLSTRFGIRRKSER